MKTKYFECKCSSSEHTIRFVIDESIEDESPEVYLEIQLSHYRNVLDRIWGAIKYIFGYECKYGHWDCVILRDEDKQDIIELLENSMKGNK